MKNLIMMVICILLGMMTLGIIFSVSGRLNRSVELQSNVSTAVEQTVINAKDGKSDSIHNASEFMADFIEQLSVVCDAESEFTVEILNVNPEKGMLAIQVTEQFQYPNGKRGKVSCKKTVIIEK